jgi:predicted RNase H-like HicB family nuclease
MKSLEVDGLVWREENIFISYCPKLDVSSCGNTVEESRTNLRTAVRLFVEEAEKLGTLDTILRESGFKKTAQGWQAPRLVATELISVSVGKGCSGVYH